MKESDRMDYSSNFNLVSTTQKCYNDAPSIKFVFPVPEAVLLIASEELKIETIKSRCTIFVSV